MTSAEPPRIAVVIEDDDDIRLLLETTLRQGGFTVVSTGTGADGVAAVREHDPTVTTLDISLPDIDGFEVARRLRTFSGTYLVMLTARSEEIDALLGLESGADDYLTKPFRPRELRARIEAMLRRPRQLATVPAAARPAGNAPAPVAPAGPPASAPTAAHTEDGVYAHNGLTLDTGARLAELDGAPVHLTRSEFDILAALLEARGRVVSKSDLVRAMWPEEYATGVEVTDGDRRTVEVHLANIRRKLGESAATPRFFETVRGVGYRRSAPR